MRLEGFYVNENPPTQAEIAPATFEFLAQHFNHCGTAPRDVKVTKPLMINNYRRLYSIRYARGNSKYDTLCITTGY